MRVASVLVAGLLAGATVLSPVASAADRSPAPLPVATDPAASLGGLTDAAIAAAGARIGADPATLLDVIRTQVTAERYAGVRKGARGAYLSDAANDADTALLLRALLAGADPSATTRLAICELAPSALTLPQAVPIVRAAERADELAMTTDDLDLAEAILEIADRRTMDRADAAAGADEVAAALSAPGGWVAPRTPAAATTVTHTWLQVADADGWRDLDPWGDATGAAPCPAATVGDGPDPAAVARVHLSIEVERLHDGVLERTEALSVDRDLADLVASRIVAGMAEPLGLVEPPAASAPGTLRTYTPALRIDGITAIGTPFALPAPAGSLGSSADEVLGEAGAAFDEAGGAASPAPEPDPVTAAWVRVVLTLPGAPTVDASSLLFDRIGDTARLGGATVESPGSLAVVGGEYASLATAWDIALLPGELRAPELVLDLPAPVATIDAIAAGLDGLLRTFPAAAHDLGSATTTPVVLVAGLRPSLDDRGTATGTLVLDAPWVPADPPADVAAAARDAIATMLAERSLAAIAGIPDGAGSASGVLAAARAAGAALGALAGPGAPIPDGASALATARIGARLAAGETVVVPSLVPIVDGRGVLAWYVVDPVTGLVRDEHENGRHTAIVEYGFAAANWTARGVIDAWHALCKRVEGAPLRASMILLGFDVDLGPDAEPSGGPHSRYHAAPGEAVPGGEGPDEPGPGSSTGSPPSTGSSC